MISNSTATIVVRFHQGFVGAFLFNGLHAGDKEEHSTYSCILFQNFWRNLEFLVSRRRQG